jgi:hypothetical protein
MAGNQEDPMELSDKYSLEMTSEAIKMLTRARLACSHDIY